MIVQVGNTTANVPTSWNELSGNQLLGIMKAFSEKMDHEGRLLSLFSIITGLPFYRLWWIGAEVFGDLYYLTDFLFGENTLTKNVIPFHKGKYGPADNFDNMLISEFVFTELHFIAFKYSEITQQEKDTALNKLIAVLYRDGKVSYNKIKNKEGDVRQRFNDNTISYDAKRISKWDLNIKLSILHWYEGCRLNLISEFEEVFSGSSPSTDSSKYGLWDLIYNIADKGTFGDFEKVEGQYLKTILMALTKIMAEAEQLKKQST